MRRDRRHRNAKEKPRDDKEGTMRFFFGGSFDGDVSHYRRERLRHDNEPRNP